MKYKFIIITLSLLSSFYFTNTVYSQPIVSDLCYPETSSENYVSDFNSGVCDAYRYISLGVGPIIFIPNFGIGYRERHSQLGWDSALSFSTIGYAHQLSAHLVGHYYFNPFQQNSPYLGLGLIGSGVFTNQSAEGSTLSPDFVFGKEFKRTSESRHFIEMHVAIPTMWMGKNHLGPMYFPLMYVKYGISF